MKFICAFHAHISARIKGAFTEAAAESGKAAGSTLGTTASFRSGSAALLGIMDLVMPEVGIQPWLAAVRKPKNKMAPTSSRIIILAPGFNLCPVGGLEIVLLNIKSLPPAILS